VGRVPFFRSKFTKGFSNLVLTLSLWLLPVPATATAPNRLCLETAAAAGELEDGSPQLRALEKHYGKVNFVTKRQNRLFKNLFTAPAGKGYLALSVDFPIVKQLNTTLEKKSRTSAIFNQYKALFFANLKADPILMEEVLSVSKAEVFYADFKNIGVLFKRDTAQIREHIERLREKTADDFLAMTDTIPELAAFDQSDKSILRNRASWTSYGLGTNGLQASTASRLGRYHVPSKGLPPIRDFREAAVQTELRQKFIDTDLRRKSAILSVKELAKKNLAAAAMISKVHGHHDLYVPSERLWDVMRKVDAKDFTSYLAQLKKDIAAEFGVEAPQEFLQVMQSYFHALDAFLPRVHERKEADIETGDAGHGVIYVDIRGQTPRNLVRMAEELAGVAQDYSYDAPNLPEVAALAVRRGQDEASRKFNKIRKSVRSRARLSGVEGTIKISGDEIVIPLHEGEDLKTFRDYVARLGSEGVPARPLLISKGARLASHQHVTDGENIEKNLRKVLKTSKYPVAEWEDLMIGIHLEPAASGGLVSIYLGEKIHTQKVSPARDLIEKALLDPGTKKWVLPEGYEVKQVLRAAQN